MAGLNAEAMGSGHKPASRGILRFLVVLTALLCLGVGGYVFQAGWANRTAQGYEHACGLWIEFADPGAVAAHRLPDYESGEPPYTWNDYGLHLVGLWRQTPWYGDYKGYVDWDVRTERLGMALKTRWFPRRTYHELLIRLTGRDLPNDPDVWEQWFREHPRLAFDTREKRLVDPSEGK
jgi:hypothetical protein